MTKSTKSDPTMDRLLRDALAHRAPPARTDGCLDAETIAAWHDRTLAHGQRAAADAHLADCARCQQILAAMVRTDETPVATSWLRMPALRWLVPATAAAAAVVIWMVVPTGPKPQPEASAPQQVAAPSAPSPGVAAPEPFTPPNAAADARQKPAEPERRLGQGTAQAQGRSTPLRAGPAAAREADRSAPAATANAKAVQAPVAPAAPPASTMMATARLERSAAADAAGPIVAAPDPNIRWRIMPSRTEVQRTSDGGATWATQSVQMPAPLATGSAPSATVCWLVGARGTVMLTTDGGGSWRRLDFPEPVDLVSIRATDDRTAIVTAADGRTFATSNGGQTWTRAPLQENPAAPF